IGGRRWRDWGRKEEGLGVEGGEIGDVKRRDWGSGNIFWKFTAPPAFLHLWAVISIIGLFKVEGLGVKFG
ncbi:MAG: hypothetical protein ACPG5T_02565, partial [Endozoicomonas sp.]